VAAGEHLLDSRPDMFRGVNLSMRAERTQPVCDIVNPDTLRSA